MNKFYVKAIGWSLEATGQFLTKEDLQSLRNWARGTQYTLDHCPGHLEGVLEGYNCYHTNGWQTGSMPLFDLTRVFIFDESCRRSYSLTAPLINKSRTPFHHDRRSDMQFKSKSRSNMVLAYFEEFKGVSAVWELFCEGEPTAEDFMICYAQFRVCKESIRIITDIKFRGQKLERDNDMELSVRKSNYSRVY